MDRTELLNHIRDGRAEWEAVLAPFDRHRLTEPLLTNGWSIKDVIAHVGFWERRIATLYAILVDDDTPRDTVEGESVDALNRRVFEENQTLPLGIVQVNEQEAYRDLFRVAESAPDADLFDPQRFAWTQGEPFANWIAVNTYEHYRDHVPDLRALAAGQ